MERVKRKLVLENGDVYVGTGFGASADAIGEIVFNTSMAGYQEIISDPSYTDQIIVMSYPIIGNYGITDEDYESKNLLLKAMVVRDYNDAPSNFRYTKTLSELLEENGVPGIQGIDTRKLVRTHTRQRLDDRVSCGCGRTRRRGYEEDCAVRLSHRPGAESGMQEEMVQPHAQSPL